MPSEVEVSRSKPLAQPLVEKYWGLEEFFASPQSLVAAITIRTA
ncbi:hypothetical protein [Nostoc sp.]